VAFRWLAGGQAPAYRAIAKFRKRHLSALGHVFVQALELCQAAEPGATPRWRDGERALPPRKSHSAAKRMHLLPGTKAGAHSP
jgi:hypothetical protein